MRLVISSDPYWNTVINENWPRRVEWMFWRAIGRLTRMKETNRYTFIRTDYELICFEMLSNRTHIMKFRQKTCCIHITYFITRCLWVWKHVLVHVVVLEFNCCIGGTYPFWCFWYMCFGWWCGENITNNNMRKKTKKNWSEQNWLE